ncbi:hypothetical protein N431DRAFT_519548 [Stipitochalara longipes BDJ]|nr:hypothetical protein N431DRAFT_519548 [Stipitochalara longipes BDJ]
MMSNSLLLLVVFVLSSLNLSAVLAQSAPVCWNLALGLGKGETCSVDPTDSSYLELYLVQDKKQLPGGVQCADSGGVFVYVISYVDIGGIRQLATAPAVTIDDSYTGTLSFQFDLPITEIQPGIPVTMHVSASESGSTAVFRSSMYTQAYVPSLVYTNATSYIIATSTSITSTSTEATTVYTTTSVPGPTVSATQTSGTQRVTAPRQTDTITSSISQKPVTHISTSVVHTTTTVSCIGSSHGQNKARQAGAYPSNTMPIVYEIPNCGAVTTTSITLSTSLVTLTTVISTDVTTTTPLILTSTFTSPAVTIYATVKATTIITPPPKILTTFTVLPRSTILSTKIITVTQTVYPHGIWTPRCDAGTHEHSPPAGLRISGMGAAGHW